MEIYFIKNSQNTDSDLNQLLYTPAPIMPYFFLNVR